VFNENGLGGLGMHATTGKTGKQTMDFADN
jgi:hypothetical protein